MSNMSFDDDSTIQKSGYEKEPRWDEQIKWAQLPDDNTPYAFRLVAAPTQMATHWLKSKKKTGERGKSFNIVCSNYDSKNGVFAKNGCEVCDVYQQLVDNAPEKEIKGNDGKVRMVADLDEDLKGIKARVSFLSNAISRDLQASGPAANNAGKWSYFVPLRLPQGCAGKLKDAQDKFNKHKVDDGKGGKIEKVFGLHHATYGKDVMISYNSKAQPADQYQVYLGPKEPVSPLTEEERSHVTDLVNFIDHIKYPDVAGVKDSLTKHGYYEVLEAVISRNNIKTLEGGVVKAPVAKVAPPAPSQPAAPAAAPSAFDADSEGAPAEPDAAGSGAEDDVPVDMNLLKGGPATVSYAQTPAAQPAAAPAAPVAAANPPPASAPAQAAPAGKDIQATIQAYAKANGLPLVKNEKKYDEDLRYVQVGTEVPGCFTKYQAVPVCKSCPVKVDCMMAG